MAKRYTDSNKYKKPFVRGLPGAYKLLWDFLYHDCDHAGIWIVDFEISQAYIGKDMPVNRETALSLFNSDEVRIIEIDGGKKWFLPSFIEFQYGQLTEKNRAHLSAILQLKKYGLLDNDLSIIKENKGPVSPLQGGKDKDKDKDKEMDMVTEGVQGEIEADADFQEYEQWTADVVNGNDFRFGQALRNTGLDVEDRIPELARSHLALLAKYPKMRPTNQNRFRISLIGHIQEKTLDKKANGKPNGQPVKKFKTIDDLST